ncbi:MAG: hypothetical protein A2W35_10575 [Chloroflexi bacterium RBG_16_57_11]|nr:MAG: hypothetical protein A2W35_10575 [Chloroflexi bacterium RBG_16_57_11]
MTITTRPCPACGQLNTMQALYCISCGRPMGEIRDEESASRTAAAPPTEVNVTQNVENALGTVIGVLQGSIGAVHINQAVLPAVQRSPRHQILPVTETYVPRSVVEDRLIKLLKARPGRINLVELYGQPGSGKSTVGQKVASDLADEFPDARLWVEVGDRSDIDILWELIDPFDAPPERSPFRTSDQYRAMLARLLGSQRVLIVLNRVGPEIQERLARILPEEAGNTAVLLISEARLADLVDPANSVSLAEMDPGEALSLFRSIWKGTYLSTPDQTLVDLAAVLNNIPHQIAMVARDIINRQVTPSDYLAELRRQRGDRPLAALNVSGFQTVFDNLPEQGRAALPFLGVMGAGAWDAHALSAVSQLPYNEIETGLRQMERVGLISHTQNDRYHCSPIARDFALSRLRQMGGEPLVRQARSVMAYQALRSALDITTFSRQSMLRDYLQDSDRKKRFLKALGETFQLEELGMEHGNTGKLQATPGLGLLDVVQDAFEESALKDENYLQNWQEWINSSLCSDQARNLEVALRWAIDQEDWGLARGFANLSIGVYVAEMTVMGSKEKKAAAAMNGLRFGAMRGVRLSRVQLESSLLGVRLIAPRLTNCELISTFWGGVRLERPTLFDVDIVNASLPALMVQDGLLTQVDFRGTDLRGSVFYNCYFNGVNYRTADLREAEFISCAGIEIDLRGARLDGIGFHNCTFTDVVYYKTDEERLAMQPFTGD